jgi:hypothetical protein
MSTNKNPVEKLYSWAQKNQVIAFLVVISAIVIGVSATLVAVDEIVAFYKQQFGRKIFAYHLNSQTRVHLHSYNRRNSHVPTSTWTHILEL